MTKGELLRVLADAPDDTPIVFRAYIWSGLACGYDIIQMKSYIKRDSDFMIVDLYQK